MAKVNKDSLQQIGKYILAGMTEKEACILSDVSYNALQHAKEESDIVREYIEKKRIEFKYNHLNQIQKARSEKNSMWVLEKLIPDEFNNRRGSDQPQINIISTIIKDIQHGDQGIVKYSRGVRDIEASENDSKGSVRIASLY